MNDSASSRRTRITTAVVGSAVAVVIAATAFGAVRGTTDAGGTATPSAAPTESATAVASSAEPEPGATVAAPIASEAPIRTDLTAEVESMEALTVTTDQPGEIGGPAVRFAVRVTNTTDAPVSLTDTVVNVAAGADAEPGYWIESAGEALPAEVPAGGSVTGVYVFTIPVADRADVTVTLDTSAQDPVVAFTGPAPQ